ncbi:MAG: hypothetical protein ACXV3D_06170 [Halobacteriota archaeon]
MVKMRYSRTDSGAVPVIFYALALATGIASVVLSLLSVASSATVGVLLGIGVLSLGLGGLTTLN